MSEITYNKKKRTARASQLQLIKMLDYFYLNKGLAEGKFQVLHGKEEVQKKWAELTTELNSIQGATKTVDQWQVVWRDLKSRISTKVKDLRKAKAATGNKPILQSELSDFELHVIGIVGTEYVEGNINCPESIPEEEHALEELERGNDSVLLETPQVITVCSTSQEISDSSPDNQYSNVNSSNNDCNKSIINDSLLHPSISSVSEIEDLEGTQNIDNCKSKKSSKTSIAHLKKNRSTPYPFISMKSTELSNRLSQIKSKKYNRVTSHELNMEYFKTIAEKQANAELMNAEAAKIQAAASEMNANTMAEIARAVQKFADTAIIQADNEKERIKVFNKLVTTLNTLLPDNTNNEFSLQDVHSFS